MKKTTAILISLLIISILLEISLTAKAENYDTSVSQSYKTQSPPKIKIESPNNYKEYSLNIPLKFTISYYRTDPSNYIWGHAPVWLGYSIDNKPFVTIEKSLYSESWNTSGSSSSPYAYWENLVNCSINVDILVDASSLSDGSHKVTVKADFMYIVEQVTSGHYNYTFPSVNLKISKPPLALSILSSDRDICNSSAILLNFTVNRGIWALSWIGYSLDNQPNVTIRGNLTIANLVDGLHSLTVYANDTSGNMAKADAFNFTLDKEVDPQPEPPPILPITASLAVVAVLALTSIFLLYGRHRKTARLKQ